MVNVVMLLFGRRFLVDKNEEKKFFALFRPTPFDTVRYGDKFALFLWAIDKRQHRRGLFHGLTRQRNNENVFVSPECVYVQS